MINKICSNILDELCKKTICKNYRATNICTSLVLFLTVIHAPARRLSGNPGPLERHPFPGDEILLRGIAQFDIVDRIGGQVAYFEAVKMVLEIVYVHPKFAIVSFDQSEPGFGSRVDAAPLAGRVAPCPVPFKVAPRVSNPDELRDLRSVIDGHLAYARDRVGVPGNETLASAGFADPAGLILEKKRELIIFGKLIFF